MNLSFYIVILFLLLFSKNSLAQGLDGINNEKINNNHTIFKENKDETISEVYDITINNNWQFTVLINIDKNSIYIPLKFLPKDLLGNLTETFLIDYKGTRSLKINIVDIVNRKDDLLTISINLPEPYFKSQIINLLKDDKTPSMPINALYVNYDINLNPLNLNDTKSTFNINWANKNQSLLQNYFYLDRTKLVRLNSIWQKKLDNNNTLMIGDVNSSSLSGLNSFSVLGARYSSSYYNNTGNADEKLPTIPISGFAVTPTKLDLYINNQIIQTKEIESGKYNLNIPYQSGGYGLAQAYVYDITGKPTIVTVPFYSNSEIIKKGDNEYDITSGFVRKDYGIKSFSYGAPIISALYKGGIFENYTQDLYVQWSSQYSAFSALSHWVPIAKLGVVNAGMTVNTNNEKLYRLGLERVSSKISLGADYQESKQFCFGFNQKCLLSQSQIFTGFSLPKNVGNINFSYVGRKTTQEDAKITTFQWSKQLNNNLSLSASFSNTIGKGAVRDNKSLYVGLSYAINSKLSSNTSFNHDRDGYNLQQAIYSNPDDEHPQYGYGSAIVTKRNDGNTENLYYGAQLSKFSYQANLYKSAGNGATANVLLSGAFSYISDENYFSFSKQINRGLTYVKIENIDIPVGVYNQNHFIGKSDQKGNLIIPDSLPLNTETISLDINKLPPNITLEEYKKTHTIPYSGVSKIIFKAKVLPFMINISNVKAGTIFSINNDFYVVGNNGDTSVDTIGKANITLENGTTCEINIIKDKKDYSCVK